MEYPDLIRQHFERAVALQVYWTVYIAVIGGIFAFSILRLRPERTTTVIVTLLYLGFAWKNLGAIEETGHERNTFLAAAKSYASGPKNEAAMATRTAVEAALVPYDIPAARYFHLVCDALTVTGIWVREWFRRKYAQDGDTPTR